MLIDCDTCVARDRACADCVMTVFLGSIGPPVRPRDPVELDDETRAAIGSLSRAGLVPPLRLVRGVTGPAAEDQATA